MGPANSPSGTSRSNTVDTIRVGRQHTFSRVPDLLTSCACTDLSPGASTTALPNTSYLSRRGLDSKLCRLEGPEMMRPPLLPLAPLRATFVVLHLSHLHATSRLFSPPSSKGCSSGGHFLFPPLPVFSLSYCPYCDKYFLLWVLYSSLSL